MAQALLPEPEIRRARAGGTGRSACATSGVRPLEVWHLGHLHLLRFALDVRGLV